jgi:CheY-like chemotaxis protein
MSSKKILVVDDDLVIQSRLSRALKSHGYEVVLAADGSEAVSAARHQKPDLIVLDITFPPDVAHGGGVPWDGFLIMDWLRRVDGAEKMPVIVITASDNDAYKQRALSMGALGYFLKPIDINLFLLSIQKVLGDVPQETRAPAA